MAVVTVPLARSTLPVRRTAAIPARRAPGLFGRFFHRRRSRQPTLFHRCLAVHMATAGTLSALR